MFEKEAEEYIMREDVITENDRVPFDNGYGFQTVSFENEVKKAFKDGAEFGYNKANEWHYVKDEDLPKENQLVLLYRENPNGANVALAYWCKSYVNDKVIAWKEIVLPKESE